MDRNGPVKVSFFGLPKLKRLRATCTCRDNQVQVASLLDIASAKMLVVQQRAEAKDYTDVAAILADGRVDLATALGAARAIHGGQFNAQITLKALSHYGDGNLATLPAHVRKTLADAILKVDLGQLPVVTPSNHTSRHGQDLEP